MVRFCEEQGICVKTKTGRAAADGSRALVIYAYCKTHEACGHVQRHDFVRSDGGWLHKIYCKGQHEEVVRAVRRRPAGDPKRRILEETDQLAAHVSNRTVFLIVPPKSVLYEK